MHSVGVSVDNPPAETLIGTSQAAAELGVTRQTIIRYVETGKLVPFMKAPGRTGGYMFTRAQIAAFRRAWVKAS